MENKKREVIVKGIPESKRNWIEGMVLVHLVMLEKENFIHESMVLIGEWRKYYEKMSLV